MLGLQRPLSNASQRPTPLRIALTVDRDRCGVCGFSTVSGWRRVFVGSTAASGTLHGARDERHVWNDATEEAREPREWPKRLAGHEQGQTVTGTCRESGSGGVRAAKTGRTRLYCGYCGAQTDRNVA